eukprot:6965902-Heterocapsa_arctica.AAC.1
MTLTATLAVQRALLSFMADDPLVPQQSICRAVPDCVSSLMSWLLGVAGLAKLPSVDSQKGQRPGV